jgi:hypothetical protein
VKPYHWALFATTVLFSLIGVPLLIFGSTEERLIGAACILLFGVSSVVWLMPLFTRRDARGVHVAEIDDERAFMFPAGTAKATVAIFAMIAMGAGCVLVGIVEAPVLGVIGVVVFGGMALYTAVMLTRPRGIAMTPTRVVVLGPGAGEVPWDAVTHVEFLNLGVTQFLGVRVSDKSRVRRRGRGWLGRMNAGMYGVDLMVAADQLILDAELVRNAMNYYFHDPARREAIGTEAELARSL